MKILLGLVVTSCSSLLLLRHEASAYTILTEDDIDVQPVYYVDTYDNEFGLKGYVSIPKATTGAENQKFPAVVILPDWNNIDDYERIRATMMNVNYGWVGFAADIYGPDLQDFEDRTIQREQATKYRSDDELFWGRIQSAVDLMKKHPNVDPNKVAVIGYCFGGTGVLTYSFYGSSKSVGSGGVVGAASFHGGLTSFAVDAEQAMAHPVLVLSGGDDDTGTQVEDLENRLNQANATWQITRYAGIEHAFTKFGDARYDAVVDQRSWEEMGTFFGERFGEVSYGTTKPSDLTTVTTVAYDDGGFVLEGYMTVPDQSKVVAPNSLPALIILPDWDGTSGPDGYEAHRAALFTQESGYPAFVADIYGKPDVPDMQERFGLVTKYRGDPALFVSRVQAAVDLVKNQALVNASEIIVAGYCFGGTGSVDYAFSDQDLTGVRAVVPIHGGLSPLRAIQTDNVEPYILVLSGGIDDAHGNNTELEAHLNGAEAKWEISRYSNVDHGFTKWGAGAYNAMADSRSWWSMMSLVDMMFGKAAHNSNTPITSDEQGEGTTSGGNNNNNEQTNEVDHSDSHDHDHDHDNDDTSAATPGAGNSVFLGLCTVLILFHSFFV